jgi:hypothetical protein
MRTQIEQTSVHFPSAVFDVLCLLLRATDYANDLHEDPWQFAVEWTELAKIGLERTDVRWLVRRRYVQFKREISLPAALQRTFVDPDVLRLWKDCAFILTKEGITFARALNSQSAVPEPALTDDPVSTSERPRHDVGDKPTWDKVRRQLRFRGQLVKAFRLPAPNQELILDSFEEEGWPEFIDDPLPPAAGIEPRRRLQATIKALNRHQESILIRFRGNGSERVFWQLQDS